MAKLTKWTFDRVVKLVAQRWTVPYLHVFLLLVTNILQGSDSGRLYQGQWRRSGRRAVLLSTALWSVRRWSGDDETSRRDRRTDGARRFVFVRVWRHDWWSIYRLQVVTGEEIDTVDGYASTTLVLLRILCNKYREGKHTCSMMYLKGQGWSKALWAFCLCVVPIKNNETRFTKR